MKITKWKNVKLQEMIVGDISCPLCKESKKFNIENTGGVEGFRYIWFKNKFFTGLYKYSVEKFKCHYCSAEWKSDIKKEKVNLF